MNFSNFMGFNNFSKDYDKQQLSKYQVIDNQRIIKQQQIKNA